MSWLLCPCKRRTHLVFFVAKEALQPEEGTDSYNGGRSDALPTPLSRFRL
jgi:hypothetical protein